ncbi:hypothetical protein N7476_004642 [Penicillium atrosanguineum]|uniref:Uncharacterized protein n=1 Tax=Penicillium atrosanguineum TaxID=1132637 RepID=A0A9W9U6V4_9EURO|nr:hypothetical protein N7476_004642 [Penicillium atrosanguineum]
MFATVTHTTLTPSIPTPLLATFGRVDRRADLLVTFLVVGSEIGIFIFQLGCQILDDRLSAALHHSSSSFGTTGRDDMGDGCSKGCQKKNN